MSKNNVLHIADFIKKTTDTALVQNSSYESNSRQDIGSSFQRIRESLSKIEDLMTTLKRLTVERERQRKK